MVISNLRRNVAVGLLIAGVCAPAKPEAVALDNNRIDDACGEPAPPGPVAGVTMNNGEPDVEWPSIASALVYVVVYGDLGLLHSSGGDFTAATQGCMAYPASLTWASFDPIPGLGQGYWLLVRGDNCAGAGTYDSGDPAQLGSRDAEIEASGHSCTQSVCGDGICNFGETTSSCPGDCPPVCGDGTCDGTETCSSCTADCGVCPPVCGDGLCNGTETPNSCPGDCPPVCGDGTCDGTETCSSCTADCGVCPPVCGDGLCNGTETPASCPGDCPPVCGDGTCDGTETCSSCTADCGVCPPVCGDGLCNGTETPASCPGDCPP